MTFLEAALEILRRERKPLHYKDITQKAMDRKLLTFVGRTPEVTMQTQMTAAVKKAPGNPFVRVKPGTFGLLRYPEAAAAPEPEELPASPAPAPAAAAAAGGASSASEERAGRRRRRGGRGRRPDGRPEGAAEAAPEAKRESKRGERTDSEGGRRAAAAPAAASSTRKLAAKAQEETMADDDENAAGEGPEEPEIGSLSPEARAAALAESGVLESDGDDGDDDDDDDDDLALEDDDASEGQAARAEGDDEGAGGEDDDDDDEEEEDDDEEELAATPPSASGASETSPSVGQAAAAGEESDQGEAGDDEGDDEATPAVAGGAARGPGGFEDAASGRRRRRRRRRRGGEGGALGEMSASGEVSYNASPSSSPASMEAGFEGGTALPEATAPVDRERDTSSAPSSEAGDSGAGRRIMSPVDAAIEILRGQAPGRGMHVRQLADAATRRRLVHGEPNEAWRVMRAALAAEPRERLRAGLRPRVRAAGSGLFALSRRPPDLDLDRSEHVFGEARRALRERTLAALEQRLGELPPSAFEAIARVLLQREGFGPATFVKRVEGTVYLEALRGRGVRPSRCLIALRPGGSPAGRRAIGELRAGIRARNQDEGVLLLAARLAEDAIAEWKQPGSPIEVADGPALAETCVRHGVGVINTMVSVDFVDADFFAELQEG